MDFGADPYARDDNHENAFDKCCDDKMTEFLKSHLQNVKIKNINGKHIYLVIFFNFMYKKFIHIRHDCTLLGSILLLKCV